MKPTWRAAFATPTLRKKREGWGTHCVGNAHKSKAWATALNGATCPYDQLHCRYFKCGIGHCTKIPAKFTHTFVMASLETTRLTATRVA